MSSLSDRLQRHNALLAPYAVRHEGMLGREHAEEEDATRFPFQRDRDRIIHATAFRRLKGKTQVFVTGDGDHYRTRLTHTLEVAQISRDIARTLGLNEDLCECIALAHDLGHPPFGHAGEHAIDEWMREHGERFEHNMQSYRIVTLLEAHSGRFPGLNLNQEILQGLLKHSTPHDQPHLPEGAGHTLEAQVVNIADEIAYTSHDCDDGLREGLFTIDLVEKTTLGIDAINQRTGKHTSLRGALIDQLVTDLYEESAKRIDESKVQSVHDVLQLDVPLIGFSKKMRASLDELRGFLWKHMYLHPMVESRVVDGQKTVRALCDSFHTHPTEKLQTLMAETGSSLVTAVKDYVAGMTDRFAETTLEELRSANHMPQ